MGYLHSTSAWFQTHPLFFTLIVSALFFCLNLYTNEIKRFIADWPKRKVYNIRYNWAVGEQHVLQSLNNNPYQLVLFYAHNILQPLMQSFAVYIFFVRPNGWSVGTRLFSPMFFGIWVAALIYLYHRTYQLMHYSQTIAQLEATIAKYAPKKEPVSTNSTDSMIAASSKSENDSSAANAE